MLFIRLGSYIHITAWLVWIKNYRQLLLIEVDFFITTSSMRIRKERYLKSLLKDNSSLYIDPKRIGSKFNHNIIPSSIEIYSGIRTFMSAFSIKRLIFIVKWCSLLNRKSVIWNSNFSSYKLAYMTNYNCGSDKMFEN